MELERYGVRLSAICPNARTRLTEQFLGEAGDGFDQDHPGNIAPFVGYLATEQCPHRGPGVLLPRRRGAPVPALVPRGQD
ncbi:hypothetical protein [Streptomyces sp. KL116D]|uniref:hypothetical protein n=1 Tax=Streptomyces sp. KL116D TaxID=3045152 RepID=UPI0035566254